MKDREPVQAKSSSILGGWKQVDGQPGTFTTEAQPQDFTTPEFANFAEASRARWDLVEYLKVKINQFLRKE